jgi:putative oxidoreductase
MNNLINLSAPLGRILLATIFVMAGINKIFGYESTQAYMEAMGVSGGLLPLVIFIEISAGVAIALGWKARISAFLLAGFTLLTAFIFHANLADQAQFIMFFKNIALAGAFLLIVHHGAGSYALDNIYNKNN